MAKMEALARMCAIANDKPSANEYLVNGLHGVLAATFPSGSHDNMLVLRSFQRVLADLGSVEVVHQPGTEVGPICGRCADRGAPARVRTQLSHQIRAAAMRVPARKFRASLS
jgi:hypothetical protein